MVERVVGVGKSLIDFKIRHTQNPHAEATPMIQAVNDIRTGVGLYENLPVYAGGMTPNILSAFVQNIPNYPVRLLACIGDDALGEFYQLRTESQLGMLQVAVDERTGLIALSINEEGDIVDRYIEHGASDYVTVSKAESDESNGLLVTDLTVLGVETIFFEIDKLISSLGRTEGQFALNLAGSLPRFGKRERVISLLNSLKKQPDFIFGNQYEFEFATGLEIAKLAANIDTIFPNSRLVVVTFGKDGALVRFDGQAQFVPSVPVNADKIIDESGAGDCFEGTMLAYLYTKPYKIWSRHDVSSAAGTAALAASMIIQSSHTRLKNREVETVRRFFRNNLQQES